ncbi:MAG: helix-turn-helix domain-containing protein [Burkholderiales bacterium]|nr:helix-turn-helix domain-containing protein [Burkholderiales bacterium]
MENEFVKLPRDTKTHPLVAAVDTLNWPVRRLAPMIGVTQQSLQEWVAKAKADRDFSVPPRRVPALCRLTGQPPYRYNPLLWPDKTWRFK